MTVASRRVAMRARTRRRLTVISVLWMTGCSELMMKKSQSQSRMLMVPQHPDSLWWGRFPASI
jgi:hypothetical protein